MDNAVSNAIELVVALILVCVLIYSGARLQSAGSTLFGRYNETVETREMLQEYREFNIYDNNIVSGADVISCILRYKDAEIAVNVDKAPTTSKNYIGTITAGTRLFTPIPIIDSDYYPENLQIAIPPTNSYLAELDYSQNGSISRIRFIKQ